MGKPFSDIRWGGGGRFVLIAGPCAIENREMVLHTARALDEICTRLQIDLVFKSSFDKANRTSCSHRGIGMEEGLSVLREVKETLGLPILTDVHEAWQCEPVAAVADILQIPAFLSRQTDLLQAAACTGRMVNVKKGQFMAPWDMQGVVAKMREVSSSPRLLLTERGSSFGYGRLVVDMTSLVEMRRFGFPIVFDATHSVQQPSSQAGITGGNRQMVPPLMRAALAVGVDALFLEVHPDPDNALSDAANQVRLSDVETLLQQAVAIDEVTKHLPVVVSLGEDAPSCSSFAEPASVPFVRLFLTDVDGVLTDGGMYYAESGDELKRFNVKDGMGLQRLQQAGIKVGIITSETTSLMERRARKLGIDYLVQGRREGGKLAAAQEICAKEGITLAETAYIGDDVNCLALLSAVGFPACPVDAVPQIKNIQGIRILTHRGGQGCVRELCDLLLSTNSL